MTRCPGSSCCVVRHVVQVLHPAPHQRRAVAGPQRAAPAQGCSQTGRPAEAPVGAPGCMMDVYCLNLRRPVLGDIRAYCMHAGRREGRQRGARVRKNNEMNPQNEASCRQKMCWGRASLRCICSRDPAVGSALGVEGRAEGVGVMQVKFGKPDKRWGMSHNATDTSRL